MIYVDTKEWLEGRYQGIGGSEAGIILGLNPWKSRLELWNEKVNKTRRLDQDAEMRLKLGNILEPFIADEYSKMTGRKLEIRGQKIHPKYSFILGNIDREIVDDSNNPRKGPGILEIKTKNAFTDWHDEIPIYYMAQLQHYLELYSYNWGAFAILDLGELKIKYFDIERDDDFISKLVKEEIEFWKLVEYKTPPDICPTKSCEEFLREKYKVSEDITIDLKDNHEAIKWATMLKEAKRNIKTFDTMETEAKNHLMSIVGNAEKAVGEGFSISWKAPKDRDVFDLEKFKREHPELAKQYIRPEPQTRRFSVRFTESRQIKGDRKEGDRKEGDKQRQIDDNNINVIKGILDKEF